jgi:hypothetical protein
MHPATNSTGENQNSKNCFIGLGNIESAGYAKVSMKEFKAIIPQFLSDYNNINLFNNKRVVI